MESPLQSYLTMIRLAWRNVLRNWRHSLATTLAIASGFAAISLFDGFIDELEDRNIDGFSTRGMLGDVIIQKQGAQKYQADDQWAYSLDAKDQKFLEDFFASDPDFSIRVRMLSITGMVSTQSHNTVFSGFGYDQKEGVAIRGKRWAWNTVAGKPLHLAKDPSVVTGMSLGHLIDCESLYKGDFILEDGDFVPEERKFVCRHDRVTLSATTEAAQVNALDFPIVGFIDAGFREIDKRAVHLSLQDAQRLLDTDKVTMVTVKLKSPDASQRFIARLKRAAQKAGLELDVVHWMDHSISAYVLGGLEILHVFRNLFMTIVVVIGVMSVANTMMKAVNERVREIGTLRSLGFLRQHMIVMFSFEGLFLSLVACGVGLVATILGGWAIGAMGFTFKAGILSIPIPLKVKMVPVAWILSGMLLSMLATGTAWFCSRRAARMVIADAMRHV